MGSKPKDISGQVFGRLTALRIVGRASNGCVTWLCRCLCGSEVVVSAACLRRGNVKSCKCLVITHHLSKSATYKSWQMMRQRCTNARNDNYRRYGALGILVCDRWRSFENFLSDMGPRPDGTSLDRINPLADYEPANCRWATRSEQNANKSNHVRYVSLDGKPTTVKAMATYLAMTESALRWRFKQMRLAR